MAFANSIKPTISCYGNNLTNENRKYYVNNVNGQNLLNGIMSYYFGDSGVNGGIYGSKWEVKHGKNWASLKSLDNTLDTAWARTQSPQHDCWKCFDRYVYVKKETSQIKIHYEWWYEAFSSQEKVNHSADYDLDFLNDYVDIGTSLIYVGEENQQLEMDWQPFLTVLLLILFFILFKP